jgi:hypothetical protein
VARTAQSLSPTVLPILLIVLIGIMAGMYWDRARQPVYTLLNAVVVIFVVIGANRAVCRKCGASLAREARGGWR